MPELQAAFEVAGLPLHPLIVHAVVVFAPLAGVGAVLYGLLPRWRWWLRLPTLVLSVVAFVSAYVAKLSGEQLRDDRQLGQLESVRDHGELGDILVIVALSMLVVFAVAAWRLGGPSGLKSDRGERPRHGGIVDLVVVVLVVGTGIGLIAITILTGDSGAEAVWGTG